VISNAYADIYAATSGMTREEARQVMKDETVLDGQMAVDMGFATRVEGAEVAIPAARFDYRMYANAPADLRDASKDLGPVPGKAAVMAMIAGRARIQQKEPSMALKAQTPAEASPADDTTQKPDATGGQTPAVVTEPTPVETPVASMQAERARARRITESVAAAGLPITMATDLIGGGKSLETCLDEISAKWKEKGDVDTPMMGRETAKITRDEVDTRRTGMTEALVAQMRRKDPASDKARPFMDMGLIAMAAHSIGYDRPVRSAGDKMDILMSATHSRSDFPGIFENALNKVLLERYEVQEPTYKAISRNRNFNDFRVHPMTRAGDFPKLQPVAEGGEIKYGTLGERRETAILTSYAIALRIPLHMMIDDDLMAIDDVVGDYGSSIANFEEETFYTFMLNAVLASDGAAVWLNTAARGNNLAAAGTAITVASLAAGRGAMRKQTGIPSDAAKTDGIKLNLAPSILLVGPDKETEADQLVTSITPNVATSVNPFSGRLTVISTAHITGNAWFLFADPARAGGACFIHGFLNGATAPRVRTDEPFGQQGMAMSVEHHFGLGAIDYRGTYRNPGA
jgi:hypothetical protein